MYCLHVTKKQIKGFYHPGKARFKSHKEKNGDLNFTIGFGVSHVVPQVIFVQRRQARKTALFCGWNHERNLEHYERQNRNVISQPQSMRAACYRVYLINDFKMDIWSLKRCAKRVFRIIMTDTHSMKTTKYGGPSDKQN